MGITKRSLRRRASGVMGGGAVALLVAGCNLGTPVVSYDVPGGDLAGGDVDGDGDIDLFVGIATDGLQANVLVNDGVGGFTPATMDLASWSGDEALMTSAMTDVNGDGFDDLLTGHTAGGENGSRLTIYLYVNDGDGGFLPVTTAAGLDGAQTYPDWLLWSAGDVNADGHPDLALFDPRSGSVVTHLGDGAGGFASSGVSSPMKDVIYGQLRLADLNGDGRDDVVVTGSGLVEGEFDRSDGFAVVGLSDGTGAFTGPGVYRRTYTFIDPGSLLSSAIGDFDGDGDQDLVAVNGEGDAPTNTMSLLLNNGDGTFATAVERPAPLNGARQLEAADIDVDGHVDLLAVGQDASAVRFGDGTTEFPRDRAVAAKGRVVVEDLNGDGRLDMAFRVDGRIDVFLNAL